MRTLLMLALFCCSKSIGQANLSELANEHYQNLEFHASFNLLMEMDSIERNEPWNTFLLANAYFACGYMQQSQDCMMKVVNEGIIRILSRFLIKAYIEKYAYDRNHKLEKQWEEYYENEGMHKMRTCMTYYNFRMYYLLIQHYDAIGDIKGRDHFKRIIQRKRR